MVLYVSEVTHHTGETGAKNVAATFDALLTLLALLGRLQAIEQLLKLANVKIVVCSATCDWCSSHKRSGTNQLIIRGIFLETKSSNQSFVNITLGRNLLHFLGAFVLEFLGFLVNLTLEVG
jgi:hypothetical protein